MGNLIEIIIKETGESIVEIAGHESVLCFAFEHLFHQDEKFFTLMDKSIMKARVSIAQKQIPKSPRPFISFNETSENEFGLVILGETADLKKLIRQACIRKPEIAILFLEAMKEVVEKAESKKEKS